MDIKKMVTYENPNVVKSDFKNGFPVGTNLKSHTGSTYQVTETGAFVRTNVKPMSKKERSKEKRMLKKRGARCT